MKSKARWLVFFLLLAFSGEILLRRWVWNQVPSQISPVWVYVALIVNVGLIVVPLRREST
jgi:TRAP-type C4-dicarboxylate transport system permease small subunit